MPVGGTLTYTIEPDWIRIGSSRLATPTTLVEFEGSTAYGNDSRIPFHVTTADWQESDRLMAGILTAFGAQTNAIEIGGYGTFDGTMLNAFKSPRIEGVLAGEHMRAWGVDWGAVKGTAVIENSYVDAKDVVIGSGAREIRADGRFSAGFPRKDGGEEINARIRVTNWPVEDLRRAFGILDYRVDGVLSGEFHPYGPYQRPFGFGTMTIANGRRLRRAVRFGHGVGAVRGRRRAPRQHPARQGRRARHRRRLRRLERHLFVHLNGRGIPDRDGQPVEADRRCRSRASSTSPPAAAAPSRCRATTCAARSATSSPATRASARCSAKSASPAT